MYTCRNCFGFIPDDIPRCPNCDGKTEFKLHPKIKTGIKILSASAVSLTLMACYGAPPDTLDKKFKEKDDTHETHNQNEDSQNRSDDQR